MLQLFQRTFTKESWPALQLPADESVVAHANPNVINFYDPAGPSSGQCSSLLDRTPDQSADVHASAAAAAADVPTATRRAAPA